MKKNKKMMNATLTCSNVRFLIKIFFSSYEKNFLN